MDNICVVMDEETYLSINGAGRQDMGEPALHKSRTSISNTVWSRMIDSQLEKDWILCNRRQELREDFRSKLRNGEIRLPNRIERLVLTANGHPDNESVLAARRVLEKQGITWIAH